MTEKQTVVDQMNRLVAESTQTLVDAAYLAQRQSAELLQAWLNTLGSNQQAQREIAAKLVQQSQEAQKLLQQFVRETAQANVESFTKATQAGFDSVNTVVEQVNTNARRTESANK
jgi:hypothetical protein